MLLIMETLSYNAAARLGASTRDYVNKCNYEMKGEGSRLVPYDARTPALVEQRLSHVYGRPTVSDSGECYWVVPCVDFDIPDDEA